jgi:motility quorum-sensing regulator/GCU-specific mRNA interferase toxin
MVYIAVANWNKPTHSLAAFKVAMSGSKRFITGQAIRDAAALGCGTAEIVAVVQTMEPKHFYKSMPSNQKPQYWVDVYHVPHNGKVLYIKLTADPDLKLLSFKEK